MSRILKQIRAYEFEKALFQHDLAVRVDEEKPVQETYPEWPNYNQKWEVKDDTIFETLQTQVSVVLSNPFISVLDELWSERVFKTELSKDKTILTIEEQCDQYFELQLNKQQVLQLAEEIRLIGESMI